MLDSERGVLLRIEALIDGEPFALSEVLEIAFDEDFEPEIFRFEPPEGEAIRSPEEAWDGPEFVTSVEEAAARASFSVWIPSRLPEIPTRQMLGPGWEIQVYHRSESERPRVPEFVSLSYWHDSGTSLSLHEQPAREGLEAVEQWQLVESEGERYLVWEPEASALPVPITVRTVREGTEVHLSSQEMTREQLLEVARSLVRAGSEPPSLRE
jgi:hypothetical protein